MREQAIAALEHLLRELEAAERQGYRPGNYGDAIVVLEKLRSAA